MDKLLFTTANGLQINIERALEIDSTTDLKNKWYGLNSTDNFGCCTYLYKKYGYPATVEEFYNKYVTDEKDENLKTYGRTEDFIMKYAGILAKRDNNRFSIDDYYSYIIKKLMYDTIEGLKWESKLNDYINSKGFTTKPPTIYEDTTLGIDIKVYKDNNLKCLVQCKPISFFRGNSNYSLINDRMKAITKEQKAVNAFGVPVFYCIYEKNKNEWKLNKKGGRCFKLKDLITQ